MHANAFSYEFPEPVGGIGVVETDGAIIRVLFGCSLEYLGGDAVKTLLHRQITVSGRELKIRESDLTRRAASQLNEYLGGVRAVFDLPLNAEGRSFSKSVYDELIKIPAGRIRTYGQIASACGNPKAARAVGSANNKNPIPIFIPCHRVIGSDGKLTGYRGGLPLKQYLLDLEKKFYRTDTE